MTDAASVHGLDMRFGEGPRAVHALDGVTLAVRTGEVLGLVGESGSGKSTLGRCLLRLLRPSAGSVTVAGRDITVLPERALRPMRAEMTMVFQDPWSALNPRMSIRRLIEEPLKLHKRLGAEARRAEGERLAAQVHLSLAQLDRTPAELSGGQLQRVCIARAVATRPQLMVLDEPTSSLDLSVRAGILALLAEIRAVTGTAMVFITHDLSTLRIIADRVAVLYLGRVMEVGGAAAVMDRPAHPYTQALLSAHLSADPDQRTQRTHLTGEIPSPIDRPPGCPFQTRCPVVEARCRTGRPPLLTAGVGHEAACVKIGHG